MMLTTLYSQQIFLIQMLFDLNCMLSIGCKPKMIITLTWLKLDQKFVELVVVGK
jgi:hypothetical protein